MLLTFTVIREDFILFINYFNLSNIFDFLDTYAIL